MYNNLDWLITKVKAITKEVTKLSNKFTQYQKKLTAGDNITIENNVISASGGGGAMMVNASFSDDCVVLDKTYEEISRALPNVVVNLENTGDVQAQYIMPYAFSFTANDVTALYFSVSTFYQSNSGVTYMEIKIDSNNETEITSIILKEEIR